MGLTLPALADQTTEYEDFYETTLKLPVVPSDTDIFVTTLPGSAVGFLVIDPLGANPETIFYNSKGADYVRCPSAVDGEGRGVATTTPRAFDAGTKIGMYSIAEYFEGLAQGKFLRNGSIEARHFSSGLDPNSWIGTGENWNYVGNNGQKEYQYATSGDKTTKYSRGMKLRLPRLTAAPVSSAKFNSVSSQFASKTTPSGVLFTTTFTCEAWINISALTTQSQTIVSRYIGGGTDDGFSFGIDANGRLFLYGAGTGNRNSLTYQTMPLTRWIHVAATLDMVAGTSTIYLNGSPVPNSVTGAATSLTQTGDLMIGRSSTNPDFFNGAISDVRVWSTVRTASQIRDNMNKYPSVLTGLVSWFKLDGNFNDSSVNNNGLTGSGGVLATNADNPLKDTEYGILTNLVYSGGSTVMTLFTGRSQNAPAENLSSISYSAARTPYGFPAREGEWEVDTIINTSMSQNSPTGGTYYFGSLAQLLVPSGAWDLKLSGDFNTARAAGGELGGTYALSTNLTSVSDPEFKGFAYENAGNINIHLPATLQKDVVQDSITTWSAIASPQGGSYTVLGWAGNFQPLIIRARCAYV